MIDIVNATCIYVPFQDGAQAVGADQMVATILNIAIAMISMLMLLFYAHHARCMTCGWEEVYVVCIERESLLILLVVLVTSDAVWGGVQRVLSKAAVAPCAQWCPAVWSGCDSAAPAGGRSAHLLLLLPPPNAVVKVVLEIFFEACPPVTILNPDGVSHIVWIR